MERLTLRESFVNGLRNKPYVNSSYLTTLTCLRPTETGLVPFTGISKSTLPDMVGDFGSQVDYVGKNILVFCGTGFKTVAGVDIPAYCADGAWTSATVPTASPRTETITSDGILILLVKATATASVGTSFTVTKNGVLNKTITLTADYQEYSVVVADNDVLIFTTGGSGKSSTMQYLNQVKLSGGDGSFDRIHYAEFGDVWFASAMYATYPIFFYCTPANGTLGAVSPLKWTIFCIRGYGNPAVTTNGKTVGAMASHMGRLYMAGFNKDDAQYATTESGAGSLSWQYLWNTYLENSEVELTHQDMTMGSTTVFYSKLNGGDYFWPFSVELAMLGLPHATAFGDAMPLLLDAIRKHEIGFFDVPTEGTIIRIESMRDTLVIFTTDGIFTAVPQNTEMGVGHFVSRISDIPAISRNAIMEIGPAIYYVNKNYRLVILSPEQGVVDVDYSIYLKTLDLDTIRMDYDFELNDLYISSGDDLTDGKCYVLTKTGMCEYGAPVYSFVHSGGSLIGYAGTPATQNNNTLATLVTETLDFGERMLKEIHSMEFGLENALNIQVRVLFKTNSHSDWQYTAWHDVFNIDNFSTPIVSGHDLRIELKFELQGYTNADFTRLEYLNLIWRRGDKRNFRLHRSQV